MNQTKLSGLVWHSSRNILKSHWPEQEDVFTDWKCLDMDIYRFKCLSLAFLLWSRKSTMNSGYSKKFPTGTPPESCCAPTYCNELTSRCSLHAHCFLPVSFYSIYHFFIRSEHLHKKLMRFTNVFEILKFPPFPRFEFLWWQG